MAYIAAAGTVAFGLLSTVGDFRMALFAAGFLFLPAAGVGALMVSVFILAATKL